MANTAFDPAAVDFQLTLEHATRGHANAQDVIKFVDTKTGILTGLVAVTTAAPLAILQWSAALDPKLPASLSAFRVDHLMCFNLLCYGLGVGMLLGGCSAVSAMHGLMARNPRRRYQGLLEFFQKIWLWVRRKPRSRSSSVVTVIFPIYRRKNQAAAKVYFDKAMEGMSANDVLREHKLQLFELGRIVNRKIFCNRMAVSFFELQVFTYFLIGFGVMILLKCGY